MPPKTKKYSDEALENALLAVRNGMALKAASRNYQVPRATLFDKLRGRRPEKYTRPGRGPHLTTYEEKKIVSWIERQGKRGFPPHRCDMLDTVQKIIKAEKRATPFVDDRPGIGWLKAFLRRNPEISFRIPERVSRSRAEVTEGEIREWFSVLKEELINIGHFDVLQDRSRVFNCDESCLQLCPKTGKVLGVKGKKNIYEVAPGPEKTNLTFLGTFSAKGETVLPTIIYPYIRMPREIVNSIPDGFIVGSSESGWMKSGNFYEFIANGFIPWLNEHAVKKPAILFVDGHRSHITLQVPEICEENGVILYVLPPNTTHILQPADVGVFRSLKAHWKTAVHTFQKENPNSVVKKSDVAPLLDRVLKSIPPQGISNAFEACGLCPFNPDKPDYTKCLEVVTENDTSSSTTHSSSPAENEEIFTSGNYNLVIRILRKEFQESNIDIKSFEEGKIENINLNRNFWETLKSKGSRTSDISIVKNSTEVEIFPIKSAINDNSSLLIECNLACTSTTLIDTACKANASNLNATPCPSSITDIDMAGPSLTQSQSQSSSALPSVFASHRFWEGEVLYKKRNPPTEKLPCMISSVNYRKYIKEKEETKKINPKRNKKSNDDWRCCFCKKLWSKDSTNSTWINCDKCPRQMHIKCVSKSHLNIIGFDINETPNENNETDFICEKCMPHDRKCK